MIITPYRNNIFGNRGAGFSIQSIIDKYATLNAWSANNRNVTGSTTTFYDYKGVHDLANPTVANQPAITDPDINLNNYASAYFVTDDYLYKSTADYLIGQSTGAIHAVFTTNADVTAANTIFTSCQGSSTNYHLAIFIANGELRVNLRNTIAGATRYEVSCDTTTILANTSYVVSVYQNGTTLQVLINGVAQSLSINAGLDTYKNYWFANIPNRDNISIGAFAQTPSTYSDLDIALVQVTSDSADSTVLNNHNELKTLYGI